MRSPAASTSAQPPVESSETEKISAYYSLAFPNFTYYLQTLTVTIGRRPNPSATSSSTSSDVDVDLGPLKSVSRLHARIEYEEEEERFVLVVLGRNGAWVDGIWAGCGSRVPLGPRSQIQIATRTFHFILPPPPEPETVSASPPPSTTHGRSPSVDITSLSPGSSHPPSPTPTSKTPATVDNGKSPASKTNISKKRKRPAIKAPKVPPDKMPPKPLATYTVMCYRAIKALGGKATLQEVIQWMIDNYEWYRLNVGGPWENSIRHNLSSNRAFQNAATSSDERTKGFLWGIDPASEAALKEQDAKAQQAELDRKKSSSATTGHASKIQSRSKSAFTTEPLKSSKAEVLTNGTHVIETGNATASSGPSVHSHVTLQLSPFPKPEPRPAVALRPVSSSTVSSQTNTVKAEAPKASIPPAAPSTASKAAAPQGQPNVILPIIVAPLPESYDSSSAAAALASSPAAAILSDPPMVVHEGRLILNPTVFSHLTPERLKELEQMGTQKALETLQADVVQFLKAKMKPEGAGRGRGRGKARGRGRGRGGFPTGKVSGADSTITGPTADSTSSTTAAVVDVVENSGDKTSAVTNGAIKREADDDVTTEEPPTKRIKLDTSEEADGDIDILGT